MATSAKRHADETEVFFADISYQPPNPTPRRAPREVAAEQEWLQADPPSPFLTPHPYDIHHTTERFDWRLRAPSRVRKDPNASKQRAKYVRRKLPPLVNAMQGEPFYDATKAYEERCVHPITPQATCLTFL
jgi:hypothetical protein